jgi:hypothetical protein
MAGYCNTAHENTDLSVSTQTISQMQCRKRHHWATPTPGVQSFAQEIGYHSAPIGANPLSGPVPDAINP